MTDQRQDHAGVPIDALALQAHCNTRLVPILAEYAPENTALNTWLMRESTGRDYPLADCGPDHPINDEHEKPTELSPEVWEGIMLGLFLLAVVAVVVLVRWRLM
ncbi:MAG TPA: hypothetical protein VMQ76_07940 [Terracidiphilus sp.]|jgi:hypothetical protein|nr:hypothetical protein [Terracidiphilus sp.]